MGGEKGGDGGDGNSSVTGIVGSNSGVLMMSVGTVVLLTTGVPLTSKSPHTPVNPILPI